MVKEGRKCFWSTVNTNFVIFVIKEYFIRSLRSAEQDTNNGLSKKKAPPMSAVVHSEDSSSTLSKMWKMGIADLKLEGMQQ